MADRRVSSIRISEIPHCIQGNRPGLLLRDWFAALDKTASGGQSPDGLFTEGDFAYAKQHLPDGHTFKRFASFGQFRAFLDQYISSQMCTPACMEEISSPLIYEEGERGLYAARSCPEAPPLPAMPKPRSKPPPVAVGSIAKEEPKEEQRKYDEDKLPWKKYPESLTPAQLSPSPDALSPIEHLASQQLQDPKGNYRRYTDGSVTIRNPELGPYPLAQGVPLDDQIRVDNKGGVSRNEVALSLENPRGLVGSETGDFFRDMVLGGGGDPNGKIMDTVFVIDASGSMGTSLQPLQLLINNLLDIRNALVLGQAKKVHFGVVLIASQRGRVEVFTPLKEMGRKDIYDLKNNLLEIQFGGGAEPVGLGVLTAFKLLSSTDKDPKPRQRHIVVITDHEGLETECGDLHYPPQYQYHTVRHWVQKRGIAVSHYLIANGITCGCIEGCLEEG